MEQHKKTAPEISAAAVSGSAPAGAVSTKEQLILAGLEELREHGISGFSTRRVAKACGISCAAPYKHFKDTQTFIAEILGYINRMYLAEQAELLASLEGASSSVRLLEISMHYITFLVAHPTFRSVIMMNYRSCSEEYRVLRGQLSTVTYEIVAEYARDQGLSPEELRSRAFAIRSMIYGAALFLENGEMPCDEATLDMVQERIGRVLAGA